MIVIPARMGPKGKALWKLAGRPLIDWALDACGNWDVTVDTESDELIEYVQHRPNVAVFRRPWFLNTNSSLVIDSIQQYAGDWTVIVQAVSPFITSEHVSACMEKEGYESVQTVVRVQHNSHWMNQRTMTGFIHERAWNSQGKPAAYQFGNCVGFSREAAIQRNIYLEPSLKVEIPRWYGLDIDDEDDLKLAEAILDAGLV